jgi:hypothetical protein
MKLKISWPAQGSFFPERRWRVDQSLFVVIVDALPKQEGAQLNHFPGFVVLRAYGASQDSPRRKTIWQSGRE